MDKDRYIVTALARSPGSEGYLEKSEDAEAQLKANYLILDCDLVTSVVRLPDGFETTVDELEGAVTMVRSLQAELLAQRFRE